MNFKPNFQLSSLYSRFITHVLAPPFVVLLFVSILGLYLLGSILYNQAIDSLERSATTTASSLQRELSLRETVLKQTGSELYIIKNEYNQNRTKLEKNRTACRAYIQQTATYDNAPNGVCDQFRSDPSGGTSLTSFDRTYRELGKAIIENNDQRISERLTAYKQFFPETMAILILNDDKSVVSSAYSGNLKNAETTFKTDAETALKTPIYGKVMTTSGLELGIFAYKIPGGSVLAAYNINDAHFLKAVWEKAPINKSQALVAILDSSGKPVYPEFKDNSYFTGSATALLSTDEAKLSLDNIEHTVIAAPLGSTSSWMVVVASPTAIILSPVRDTLWTAAAIIGLLLVLFLWVGTFFIRRASSRISALVSGAKKFGNGHLHHKIKLGKHSESEFSLLAETMNAMAQHIATTEKAIDEKNKEFISIATHELRAPLTAIIGNISLFKDTHKAKLNKKETEKINQAYLAATRLRDLVNDMLDVAHLESSQTKLRPLEPVDITSVVSDILNTMEVVANDAKITLTYNTDGAKTVMADKQLLHIVMNNFVSNALKYSRPHDKVTISHKLEGKRLITIIEDTGLGIPEDQQAHMFEKFFRVRLEDRANITGTGLGMYIVKQYIEQMHGRVSFTSVYGEGTKFSFSLPIADTKINPAEKTK